jgi:hypothetical protein
MPRRLLALEHRSLGRLRQAAVRGRRHLGTERDEHLFDALAAVPVGQHCESSWVNAAVLRVHAAHVNAAREVELGRVVRVLVAAVDAKTVDATVVARLQKGESMNNMREHWERKRFDEAKRGRTPAGPRIVPIQFVRKMSSACSSPNEMLMSPWLARHCRQETCQLASMMRITNRQRSYQ